jgi:LacI family transcriptional regulator
MRNEVCFEGYLEGLKKNNIVFTQSLVWNFSELDKKLADMRNELKNNHYAFYVPNDATARDISNHLQNHGFKIPEEVSIIGFYNRNYARFFKPALTTVGFDHELMGITVAKKLSEIISGKKPESAIIPVKIIVRESVSKPQRMLADA